MLKKIVFILCLQFALISLLADDNGVKLAKIQIQPDDPNNLPPPPKFPSYQEVLGKASSSMLGLKNTILASADKNDQKAVMLSNLCADNLQKISDNLNTLMKIQKAYEPNKQCAPIFEPEQCNVWTSEDCVKLAEKTQKLSDDMLNKAKDADINGKASEADSYKTASRVASDVAKIYGKLAQNQSDFLNAVNDLADYTQSKDKPSPVK